MSKYPKVNYIGNKSSISKWIIDSFPITSGTILDIFSGGASVSYELKKRGFRTITNDILFSNFVLGKAIIENSSIKLNEDVLNMRISEEKINGKFLELEFLKNKLFFDYEVKELSKLVLIANELDGSEKNIFLSLLRRAMIRKLPYSRMNVPWEQIKKLRDEEYSYEKYKRRRAYHNLSFEDHIKNNLNDYNNAIFDNSCENKAYNLDALEMIDNLHDKVDLIYMDPPYPSTMNKYESFYGDFDKIFVQRKEHADYTNKLTFIKNLNKLIEFSATKSKYIAISLNNSTNPNETEIENIMRKYGEIRKFYKEHQYKVTNSINKNSNIEILLLLMVE
ncbi:MAG: DNA adenine methylase [Peptostreptococcaceae bacterium]|nr:DNA adenine methylase [Peptostreptococcaceae bacterium]